MKKIMIFAAVAMMLTQTALYAEDFAAKVTKDGVTQDATVSVEDDSVTSITWPNGAVTEVEEAGISADRTQAYDPDGRVYDIYIPDYSTKTESL